MKIYEEGDGGCKLNTIMRLGMHIECSSARFYSCMCFLSLIPRGVSALPSLYSKELLLAFWCWSFHIGLAQCFALVATCVIASQYLHGHPESCCNQSLLWFEGSIIIFFLLFAKRKLWFEFSCKVIVFTLYAVEVQRIKTVGYMQIPCTRKTN